MQFLTCFTALYDFAVGVKSTPPFSSRRWRPLLTAARLLPALLLGGSLGAGEVRLVETDHVWSLTRDGSPFAVHGVGGYAHPALAARLGATTVRTWGVDQLEKTVEGRPLLDTLHHHGLAVMVGLWLGHERHGFDYTDPGHLARQRDEVRAAVRKYRHHPALLLWGLGNEMEGPPGSERARLIFSELEVLARIVREEDPDHPISTVVAVGEVEEVAALRDLAPTIDILGVNAYGNAPDVADQLRRAGWKKPFLLTEFGPLGHWEVPTAPWGAPIEPSSADKAARYLMTHRRALAEGRGLCLGTFAFVWGHKQETTGTWYGMFLPGGEKLPSVDAMAYAWTGRWPENRSPLIEKLDSSARLDRVPAGSTQTARVVVREPEGDAWTAEWFVQAETTDRREGGDREAVPPVIPDRIRRARDGRVEFLAPEQPGPYRLFVVIRDRQGGASADNFPFYVEPPATP